MIPTGQRPTYIISGRIYLIPPSVLLFLQITVPASHTRVF
jgi:hypothetical protein